MVILQGIIGANGNSQVRGQGGRRRVKEMRGWDKRIEDMLVEASRGKGIGWQDKIVGYKMGGKDRKSQGGRRGEDRTWEDRREQEWIEEDMIRQDMARHYRTGYEITVRTRPGEESRVQIHASPGHVRLRSDISHILSCIFLYYIIHSSGKERSK